MTNNISKEQAIANYLNCEIDDLIEKTYDHYGLEIFDDYAIGTDEEADKAVADYIEQTAWAFNTSFLAEMTDLPYEVFEAMQDKCEGSNEAVLKLIHKTCGLEDFVEAAIGADGRGHFLSSYDGHEIEQDGYFIYKI